MSNSSLVWWAQGSGAQDSMGEQARIDSGVVRRWPSLAARRWFEAFTDSAASDSNVLALIAVGSAVRSNVQSDDLDLVVVCRNRKLFHCRAPVEVDVHAFEAARLETMLSSGHPLLGWAVRLGRVVFDRHGYWKELLRIWHGKVPLPDPALARHRAARVANPLAT